MLNVNLVEKGSEQELYIAQQNGDKVLITQTHAQVAGLFNAKTLNAPGTVIVTEPDADGCVVITDIVLTSDKTQGSSITVQFTDNTNTIPIITADITDAPIHLSASLNGFCKGWRNARVEFVITGGVNPTATLALGYFKLHKSLLYSEWESLR